MTVLIFTVFQTRLHVIRIGHSDIKNLYVCSVWLFYVLNNYGSIEHQHPFYCYFWPETVRSWSPFPQAIRNFLVAIVLLSQNELRWARRSPFKHQLDPTTLSEHFWAVMNPDGLRGVLLIPSELFLAPTISCSSGKSLSACEPNAPQ